MKDRPSGERSVSMKSSSLAGERILVTGGAGTIGSHLVDQLIGAGAEQITVLDNFVRGRRENLALGDRERHRARSSKATSAIASSFGS